MGILVGWPQWAPEGASHKLIGPQETGSILGSEADHPQAVVPAERKREPGPMAEVPVEKMGPGSRLRRVRDDRAAPLRFSAMPVKHSHHPSMSPTKPYARSPGLCRRRRAREQRH